MTVVRQTPEEFAELAGRLSADPAVNRLYELTKAHAEKAGGETLAVWQLHMGRLWGRPYVMTVDEVARRLSLPVSLVTERVNEVNRAVRPKWFATREYKESQFASQ